MLTLASTATAPKGRFLPQDLARGILNHTISAHDVLRMEAQAGDQQVLQLSRDGITKTYVVEKGDLPKLQIAIPTGISDDGFVAECIDRATELCGVDWDSNWCS